MTTSRLMPPRSLISCGNGRSVPPSWSKPPLRAWSRSNRSWPAWPNGAWNRRDRLLVRPLGDAPFAGVPFLLKDNMHVAAGIPYHNGSRIWRGWVPPQGSGSGSRFKAAGLIVLGSTKVPELSGSVATPKQGRESSRCIVAPSCSEQMELLGE